MPPLIGAKLGPFQRKAVGQVEGYVLVQEIWDTTAPDLPWCAWPRGSRMEPHVGRNVVMYRSEAAALGLVPKAN